MKVSVIIPTHNRAEILEVCLYRLSLQKGVDFEVIVVDDGSTEACRKLLRKASASYSNVRLLEQPKSHQGVARNQGVRHARGEVIVFIGDDIFVEPDFLKTHWERHQEFSAENMVVLGFSTWDPSLPINDYMRFLESSGWQFGYEFLSPGWVKWSPHKFFYTSNISMKKSFFEKERFNEQFKVYGWEDVELGYRLWKNHDMKLYYEPKAAALHHHYLDESHLPKKMRNVGYSAVHFERLQPEAKVIPRGVKGVIIGAVSHPLSVRLGRLFGKKTYYKLASWQAFREGTRQAGFR